MATRAPSDDDAEPVADRDRRAAGTFARSKISSSRHEARVFRVLRLLGVPASDRDDVAQNVFLRIFRSLDGFRAGRPFSSWVYKIAANAALDWRSQSDRQRREEAPWDDALDEAAGTPPATGSLDLARRLEAALLTACRSGNGRFSSWSRSKGSNGRKSPGRSGSPELRSGATWDWPRTASGRRSRKRKPARVERLAHPAGIPLTRGFDHGHLEARNQRRFGRRAGRVARLFAGRNPPRAAPETALFSEVRVDGPGIRRSVRPESDSCLALGVSWLGPGCRHHRGPDRDRRSRPAVRRNTAAQRGQGPWAGRLHAGQRQDRASNLPLHRPAIVQTGLPPSRWRGTATQRMPRGPTLVFYKID